MSDQEYDLTMKQALLEMQPVMQCVVQDVEVNLSPEKMCTMVRALRLLMSPEDDAWWSVIKH